MSRAKHFQVITVLRDTAGKPTHLYGDLSIDRDRRRRQLEALDDRFLFTKQELKWRPGPEGRWILVQLGKDWALCQWDPGSEVLWKLGRNTGRLKIIRIVRKSDVPAVLRAYAPGDQDD